MTNILDTPLAAKCTKPFKPASGSMPASALCCTSDLTLAEFKMLMGKMDAFDPSVTTVQAYLGGTPSFCTNLYTPKGTLLLHKESIALFSSLDAKFTPEIKTPSIPMLFAGFSQEDFASKMLDEYLDAGIDPKKVWPQSFLKDDILFWISDYPEFSPNAAIWMVATILLLTIRLPSPLKESKLLCRQCRFS
jgi:glycerophosphoryl diester phosphodiesterase